ncbi:chemotaxis protein CheB [Chloroflexia bacterium SDU3-3]|nr:chemotaxis protein CheB [Chloroflexia bacterium SDU3-3]
MAQPYGLVVVGTSQGGLNALIQLLGGLDASFPLPLAVAQHRSPEDGHGLADFLSQHSPLPVVEVEDKSPITPGQVALAPADYHLMIDGTTYALSTEAPVNSARPSIDVLFETAALALGARAVGIILTGASHDGAAGLAAIKRAGGVAVVQTPASAESRTMPEAAIHATSVDHLLPLDEIAPLLQRLRHGGATTHSKDHRS